MTTTTRDAGARALQVALGRLDVVAAGSPGARAWLEAIATTDDADDTAASTVRHWFDDVHTSTVETLQVLIAPTGLTVTSAWEPGPRRVDARATFVALDDSRRYYAGLATIATSPTACVAWDDAARTLIAYRLIEGI